MVQELKGRVGDALMNEGSSNKINFDFWRELFQDIEIDGKKCEGFTVGDITEFQLRWMGRRNL